MRNALLKIHIAILLWGATAVLGKKILLNEIWLVWYRIAFTLIGLLLIHLFLNDIKKINWQQKRSALISGSLLGLHWLCFFASVQYGNVAIALICLSSTSFFTSILQTIYLKTKINLIEIVLSLFALGSILLLFINEFALQKGIVYGLLAAILVAIVPILNKQQMQSQNIATISFWNMIGGFIIISFALPIYCYFIPQKNFIPTYSDFGYLLILSFCCTIITLRLSLSALQKISAFTQNLLLNLEPVYGITLAAIFLNEYKTYNIYFYIGISFLIATIIIQTMLLKNKKTN